MKNLLQKTKSPATALLIALLFTLAAAPCRAQDQKHRKSQSAGETIYTNTGASGIGLTIDFEKGVSHNHPLMAFWIEDMNGTYIQTLFVARSIARGVFAYADQSTGKWESGELLRPAALPYWSHKRNVPNSKGNYMPEHGYSEVADAVSGPTPTADFRLITRTDSMPGGKFRVLCELNQAWDWNQYWTNNKFPDDREYKTSAQPAVVYEAVVDPSVPDKPVRMHLAGRSNASGADGLLYNDVKTLTTALQIAASIAVNVHRD